MSRFILFIIISWFTILSVMGQNAGKTTVKSSNYQMHVVKFGETLTKIAQKYDVPKVEILKNNPSLTENSINPDQIIRIPKEVKNKDITVTKSTISKEDDKPLTDVKTAVKNVKYHIVEKGQTLFSIAKTYNITVSDIVKWNNLPDLNVKIGTSLMVNQSSAATVPVKTTTEPATVVNTKPEIDLKPVLKQSDIPSAAKGEMQKEAMENPLPATDEGTPDIQASFNETQKELSKTYKLKAGALAVQLQKGTGAPMTTTLGAMETTYFAMHKTLSIGTVIKIKNLTNSKIVYAKVIGKLPETDENKHVMLRYSMGVKKDLQLQNGKCYLQIEYPN
ncbi:MAG: LysM peptidoglycan-binding domain-containing protein [Sphingobacteriales bacterium]|nr:LysM peptidoglycan-binding domain-containing protein [Sphingobacteriales bacterium]